jgi:hypothetical protein
MSGAPPPAKKGAIEVNASSMIGLKVELARAQERYQQQRATLGNSQVGRIFLLFY